ncbi:MAG: serine/threonine-protein kinase [Thiohalocapsa sp.]
MQTSSSIGRYAIKRWITSGAMGDIYEAYDPVMERQVALKVLRRELTARDDANAWLERFRQEARAAGRLLHPNIVTLLDYGEQDDLPFLAMEYIEGESLDVTLKRSGRFSVSTAVAIIVQALGALEFAHSHYVIHRDVKPSNILLAKNGIAKITDFGIAHIEASELTGPGDVIGTPSYMAPEQLAGKPVELRADLFSAAAVLFDGVKPFQGGSLAESLLHMEQRGPSDLSRLNPEVPSALKGVIETALSYDPGRRYASAAEFSHAIAAAAKQAVAATPVPNLDETLLAAAQPLREAIATEAGTIDLLAEAERDLTSFIGPLARIAVRRSAKNTGDVTALYEMLAKYIDDERDRLSFIDKGRQRVRTGLSSGVSAPDRSGGSRASRLGATMPIAPEALSRIETDLTRYIGPIAPIVLRQLLSRSTSLFDFYRDLAAHIPDEGDRTNFLNARYEERGRE